MIRVLGICGSPRDGNSKFLLEKAIEAAETAGADLMQEVEAEYWSVRGKKLSGCVACGGCGSGNCVINDDFPEIYEKWLAADVVIYSAPVYHMGVPAQLKAIFDRLGNTCFGRYARLFPDGAVTLPKSLKTIGCIAQGAHVFSGQEHAIADMMNHAMIMGCVPVAGDMWESYTGAGGWTGNDDSRDALKKSYDAGGADSAIAVKASESVAKRAVEIAAILKTGGGALLGRLKTRPEYTPFMERIDISLN